MEKIIVDDLYANWRIDKYLAEISPFPRSRVQEVILEGKVLLNGKKVKPSKKIKPGDIITYYIEKPKEYEILPENIPLNIVYEDSSVIVINKQPNLIVHPTSTIYSGTLVNALLYHCKDLSGIGGEKRPGIVHRLDKDTSGTMIIAKNDFSHNFLSKEFQERNVEKYYLALIYGHLDTNKGVINLPIGRDKNNRKKMSVNLFGRESITKFELLKQFKNKSLVLIRLMTGRTHQIRVHFKHINHPLVGEKVYQFKSLKDSYDRQMLHSFILKIRHPVSKKYMRFVSTLPDDFKKAIIDAYKE